MPRIRKQSYKKRREIPAAKRKLETLEQRAHRLEKSRTRAAIRRACETDYERAVRLARERARVNTARANLRQAANAVSMQIINQNTVPKCLTEINHLSLNKLSKNQTDAYTRLKAQQEAAAKRAAERRRQETPEQRAIRLEKGRIRAALLRACESEEARAVRLARQRKRTNAARLSLKCNIEDDAIQQISQQTNELNRPRAIPKKKIIQDKYFKLDAENCEDNKATRTQLNKLYYEHIAYRTFLFWEAQQQAACSSFNDDTESTEEDFRLENYSESFPCLTTSVNVDCEVTIEEGNELDNCMVEIKSESTEETKFHSNMGDSLTIKQEIYDTEDHYNNDGRTSHVEFYKQVDIFQPEMLTLQSSNRRLTQSEGHTPVGFEFDQADHTDSINLKEEIKQEVEEKDCNS